MVRFNIGVVIGSVPDDVIHYRFGGLFNNSSNLLLKLVIEDLDCYIVSLESLEDAFLQRLDVLFDKSQP